LVTAAVRSRFGEATLVGGAERVAGRSGRRRTPSERGLRLTGRRDERRSRWWHRRIGTSVPRSRASARGSDTGRPARRQKERSARVGQRTDFGPGGVGQRAGRGHWTGGSTRTRPPGHVLRHGPRGEGGEPERRPRDRTQAVTDVRRGFGLGVHRESQGRGAGTGGVSSPEPEVLRRPGQGAKGPCHPRGVSGTDQRCPRALCPREPAASPGADGNEAVCGLASDFGRRREARADAGRLPQDREVPVAGFGWWMVSRRRHSEGAW
jgi:hypothetical protein